ncbi:MAG: hypothetical protein QXJ96_03370 [Candidatus Aenigmatarchaeota archaeon]|nr:hypothetical protein [Candidatus Aenigmarchaeota archaeon]
MKIKEKKIWFEIKANEAFENKFLGEALAEESKELLNKRIEISLSELYENSQRFFVKVIFKILKVDEKNCIAYFDGHEIIREYISHIVRKGVRRIDNNIIVQTKDGSKVRVKGLVLFASRVSYPICKKARKIMDEIITNVAKNNNIDDFAKLIIFGDLGKLIKERCEKLYPVSVVDIRKSEVISRTI